MGSPLKAVLLLSLLIASTAGCATASRESPSPPNDVRWPKGEFVLEGSVEYRRDTESAVRTVEETYRAEAEVLADGSVRLKSSSGPCREFGYGRSRQGTVPRQRVFWCDDVSYVLKPGEEAIRGEVRVWVMEAIQGQGICRRYAIVSGKEVCVDYPLEVHEHAVDMTAPLTVVEKSPA